MRIIQKHGTSHNSLEVLEKWKSKTVLRGNRNECDAVAPVAVAS